MKKDSTGNLYSPADFLRRTASFPFHLAVILIFTHCLVAAVSAQETKPDDLVPPPPAIISKEELLKFESEDNIKKRTELAIELMEARLVKASSLASKNQFQESLVELGGFQAILRNAFSFLKTSQRSGQKVLNNFKRFEINLRQFMPKLELIRREMPIKYGYHVRSLMKFVRETRADAVEPLFSDSVLREDG